jgi:DNA replication protein DnaC
LLELARCEFIKRKKNILALGNSDHIALAMGLAACQKGFCLRFTNSRVAGRMSGSKPRMNAA